MGTNNGLISRLDMRDNRKHIKSHCQHRLAAIVSWVLKRIREMSIINSEIIWDNIFGRLYCQDILSFANSFICHSLALVSNRFRIDK